MQARQLRAGRFVCGSLMIWAAIATVADGKVIYVSSSATGANNGDSWANAYTSLQSGIAAAASGDQIWVATGTYKPTTGTDRTISFQMKSGVAVYGGFPIGNPVWTDRNWNAYPTTLSGDIGTTNTATDNSYHVVAARAVSNAVIDGFTVIRGRADGDYTLGYAYGAGLFCDGGASVAVSNCTFLTGYAEIHGGGMFVQSGATSAVTNCTFRSNQGYGGGGMANRGFSQVTGCRFIENSARYLGGGMFNEGCSPVVANCLFHANSLTGAQAIGGGMSNNAASPQVINCTFYYNTGGSGSGGGMGNTNSSPMVTNCILWSDIATASSSNEFYNDAGSSPVVTYCDVQRAWGQGLYPGTANINEDPLFLNVAGDDFHIPQTSPCLNKGNSSAPNLPATDLDGNKRVMGSAVDMGAYEILQYKLTTATEPSDGTTIALNPPGPHYWPGAQVTLTAAPAIAFGYWTGDLTGGTNPATLTMDADKSVTAHFPSYALAVTAAPLAGGTVELDPSGGLYPKGTPVTVTAKENPGYVFSHFSGDIAGSTNPVVVNMDLPKNAVAHFNCTLTVTVHPSCGTVELDPPGGVYPAGTQVTLRPKGTLGYSFSQWGGDLSGNADPATVTVDAAKSITAEFVLGGPIIYVKADAADSECGGGSWDNALNDLRRALALAVPGQQIWVAAGTYKPTKGTDRTISFEIKSGVAVYGGFAGNEPASFNPARCNFAAHPTILSGDLLANDGPGFTNIGDNSYSVVTGDAVDATAILDGFTVTAGEADSQDSNPTPSSSGGGVFLSNANPTFRNCTFARNRAWIGGGGMCNLSSSPTLTRCLFDDNHVADGAAGAVLNYNGSNAGFTDCTFVGNSTATYGGAMYNVIARVSAVNCAFYGNSSELSGGAVSDLMGPSTFTNCLFSGNKAENHDTPPGETYGGAIMAQMSATELVNCTFWKNSATHGGGVVNAASTSTWPILANCILWDNPGGEIFISSAQYPQVSHSDVKGGASGPTNINSNPLFADADGPDNIIGTADDNLHLLAGSPCIDAGGNAAVPLGVLTDLMGAARFFDDSATADCRWLPGTCGTAPIVDMGAYEYIPVPCDVDHDGDVDGTDLAAFASCVSGPAIPRVTGCAAWDFDKDNDVDQADFGIFQRCYSGAGKPGSPACSG